MSDEVSTSVTDAASAGAMLRRARESAGLELGTLSATIKVAQRKLEWLEADRYDQLPDAVFTRALALTVCRALKIDSAPVLALLPAAKESSSLEHVTQGLNQPFDERGGGVGRMLSGGWNGLLRPGVLAPLCLVGGAAALYFWPHHLQIETSAPAPVAVASAPVEVALGASESAPLITADHETVNPPPPVASEPPEVSPNAGEFAQAPPSVLPGAKPASAVAGVSVAASAPRPAASVAAQQRVAAPSGGALVAASGAASSASASASAIAGPDALALKAKEDTWIEARDAKGRVLLSRLMRAGEAANVSGQAPLQLKIGNARGTELQFRGHSVDLSAVARDNVVRMELK